MKKSIFIFVALIFSITSLFSKNIYAKVVDIDMSKYELVDDITLSWEIIGEGYSGPLFESNLFEVKRNQIYLFPMANTTTNLYEDIRLKFYDSNNDLVEEMYASTTYDDDDLKWGRIVNPDDVISVIYLTVPENANFLKMEASAFGQESDEEFTKLIHDFIKVYKYKTDEIPPVIQGQGVYITNVEHPILLDDVKKSLEAIDNVDGDISKSLIIKEENYTGNEAKIGTYEVLFECKDKSNNIAQYKVTIKVYDVTDPDRKSVV